MARPRPPLLIALAVSSLVLAPSAARAQERGAAALGELIQGLGVNARVLVIGAHPDDEDTQLIAWLARGQQVETAYLSLTRGDGGQNLIGNELGEALGAIRTEELLAARRIDGGHQFFTRAFDFGFSKSAEETYTHWPKDSILRDVVTVVRAFRPHVIVAIFSGTPRDGHGHHQVSGLLAREAYDVAGDSVRFPARATASLPPWTPLKFYRSARWFGGETATLRFDVGEYSPLWGRSYAEIAALSRSQHKSQGMGTVAPRGSVIDMVRREAMRAPAPADPKAEGSIFDGIDTTWSRIARHAVGRARTAVDSIPSLIAAAQRAYTPYAPQRTLPALGQLRRLARALLGCIQPPADSPHGDVLELCSSSVGDSDLRESASVLLSRVDRATVLASGVGIEATADREVWAASEPVTATVAVYNRTDAPVKLDLVSVCCRAGVGLGIGGAGLPNDTVAPHGRASMPVTAAFSGSSEPWWLTSPRRGDVFGVAGSQLAEDARLGTAVATLEGSTRESRFGVTFPIVYRFADPVKGAIEHPIAIVPAISVTVDEPVQYVPADKPIDRVVRVHLESASGHPRSVRVTLRVPRGLVADSASRTIGMPNYAGAFGDEVPPAGPPAVRASQPSVREVEFRISGKLAEGRHTVAVVAESEGEQFTKGYTLVDYDHIRPIRIFREATITLSAVDVQVGSKLDVAYVPGVGDNVTPMLRQLGIALTVIEPEKLASTDLSRYTTVVVGPRAYESSPDLVTANPRLFDFARAGGTLVVQYGQYEMQNPGLMPYPITIARSADRVTEEDAAVRVTDSSSEILAVPNKIDAHDWAGWVQERALYMPRTHDGRYRTMLSMHDRGEQPNDGAILVAPVGKGTYVYTTLALFRQLPAGVPGAARLMANLLGADQRSAGTPLPAPRP